MSASPPCSPPRRPLHERSISQNNSDNSRLQIRVVPYSPPRLSDVSSSADVDANADASVSASTPEADPYFDFSPSASLSKGKGLAAPVPNLRRLSSRTSPTPTFDDSWDFDSSSHNVHEPLSSSPPSPRPPSRRKVISVHADGTFSVHPQDVSFSSSASASKSNSRRSRPSNTNTNTSTTRSSSYGGLSSIELSFDDRPSSPLTPLTERSVVAISPAPSSERESSSPWNYRMIGGLRKVRKTSNARQQQHRNSSGPSSEPALALALALPPLPELALPTLTFEPTSQQQLTEKPSFQSSFSFQTDTTLSEKTNYKVYGQSSPVNIAELDSLPPSSSHSNYRVLAPPSSTDASVNDYTRPHTRESDANYVVHRTPSASSLVAVRKRVRPEFSRESLVVPPLRPGKRSSSENVYMYRSRSRDSIRTGSLTSLSTVLTQEATRAVFAGPATLLNQGGVRWQESFGPSNPVYVPPMPEPRPHQWSCQLSTVLSESEGGSEGPSRSLSPTSAAGRRGSAMSWQMLSMSSSLAGLDDRFETPSHSRHGSVDRPQPTYSRTASRDPTNGIRLIRDQDEDGDGLADLEVLRHRPSRTRLGHYLASRSSDPSLRSGSSSRANSFNSGSLPTWARVYYGSGERKWLAAQASSDSMFSQFSESRAGGSFLSRSSSRENHTHNNIFNPRRRPRDSASARAHRSSNTGSMEMTPLPPHPVMAAVRSLKKQTSSIWSPHLGRDRRASGYGMWDAPDTDWTVMSELTGRRNAQIVMFVVGFIFPFAWMMASFFPIPSYNNYITKHDGSPSNLDSRHNPIPSADEIVYRSLRWWRNVNRGMSIIGLLVLGAVIALIVVGVRQRWGS